MLCWIQRGPNHIKTEHLQQISMRNIALSPGKCWRSQRGQSSSVHQMAHPFNSEAACAWHASPYQARLRVSWEVCLISSCHLFSSSAIHLGASTNTAKKKNKTYLQMMLNKPDQSDFAVIFLSICSSYGNFLSHWHWEWALN